MQAWNPSTLEKEARGSGDQGQLWLLSKYKVSLSWPCLENNSKTNKYESFWEVEEGGSEVQSLDYIVSLKLAWFTSDKEEITKR